MSERKLPSSEGNQLPSIQGDGAIQRSYLDENGELQWEDVPLEEMRREFAGVHEISFAPGTEAKMKAMGITPDEILAMLMKASGNIQ